MLLEVDNLRTYFHTREGVVRAVDGVSYALEPGETLGIVGESGSGKSVSCYSLLGLIPRPPGRIESGNAWFDVAAGERFDLLDCSEAELRAIRGRRIGMIFQDPMTALNPYMRIGAQLIEPLLVHNVCGREEARERGRRALEAVGIQDAEARMRSWPHEFSGGMRQRVMIAMALIAGPDLLIADEPTTALDVTVQAQILQLIKRLQRERPFGETAAMEAMDAMDVMDEKNQLPAEQYRQSSTVNRQSLAPRPQTLAPDTQMAVILITHDLAVVAGACDRVLVMYAGRIVESAATDELYERPRHPYTEALLRAVPSACEAGKELYTIPGAPPDLARLPAGCAFEPRCEKAVDRCRAETPELREVAPGHCSACLRVQAGEL